MSSAHIDQWFPSSKIYWTIFILCFPLLQHLTMSTTFLIFLLYFWPLLFRLFCSLRFSLFILYMLITQKGSTQHKKLFSICSENIQTFPAICVGRDRTCQQERATYKNIIYLVNWIYLWPKMKFKKYILQLKWFHSANLN